MGRVHDWSSKFENTIEYVRQVETNVKEIKEAFEDVQRIITH